VLKWALSTFGDSFAIATSFQKEGMVIVDMAVRLNPRVRVFTLDTGRLPDETYLMMDAVKKRYAIDVEVVRPDPAEVADMVSSRGVDLFYESPDNRRLCCEIRKVRPLERKLAGLEAWAVGLRRDQSCERAETPKVQSLDGRVKISPLADWDRSRVDAYVSRRKLPVHPLYTRGFATIGCAPCTRSVKPGEDERAGRWWWEQNESKECGIHVTAAGLVRRSGLH
ncbi:MAG TPA: phosphoadenylyl-sulfate reductase, partial [Candidatus Sulfopaludibacter sp.]|nr:phosphoadenylyl-sulfate reductase [Candidatus Sulfopaludibacter sp.]